ncbi:hypothetical protein GCM10029964_071460 [Kibdelosporangium lantanae]
MGHLLEAAVEAVELVVELGGQPTGGFHRARGEPLEGRWAELDLAGGLVEGQQGQGAAALEEGAAADGHVGSRCREGLGLSIRC